MDADIMDESTMDANETEASTLDENVEILTTAATSTSKTNHGTAKNGTRTISTITNLQPWSNLERKFCKKKKMSEIERIMEQQKRALATDGKQKTPLATLEMILTTKAFDKVIDVKHLPKLPTYKNEFIAFEQNSETDNEDSQASMTTTTTTAPAAVAAAVTQSKTTKAINLPKPLPKGITVKPVVSWKRQVECLRKTVQAKLKETKENEFLPFPVNVAAQIPKVEKRPPLKKRVAEAASQTAYKGFINCGLIQRVNKTGTFYLTCFKCAVVFKLADYQQYIEHYDSLHNCLKRAPVGAVAVPIQNLTASSAKRVLLPTLANRVGMDFNEDIIEKDADDDSDDGLDEIQIIENVDATQDCEDLLSLSSIESDNEHANDNDDGDDESNPKQNNTDVIDFSKTHMKRIIKFLQTLRSHPVLWHPRRYGQEVFDKEAEKFLKDFDQSMTAADLRKSLENARELKRKFSTLTLSRQTKLECVPYLRTYLNFLDEIAMLSKPFAFNCDKCNFYFLDESDLLKHKYKKHKVGDISHICSCGLHFADAQGKQAHERTHNTEPNYVCQHCDRSFFTQKKVENHILLNHPDAVPNQCYKYKCNVCEKSFPHQYMLKWHTLKHEPPRFNCEICGKGYRKGFDFKNHMKKHLNQRDFMCEECGKGFFAKDRLRTHRLRVHKAGEYSCQPCRTYFASKENLHEHMEKFHPNGENLDRKTKMHTKHVKKYHDRLRAERLAALGSARAKRKERKPSSLQCRNCGLKFERFGQLRKHKIEMNHFMGNQRYKCPHCQSILNSSATFVMHLRKQHQLPTKYTDIKQYKPYTEEDAAMDEAAGGGGGDGGETRELVIEEVLTGDEYEEGNIVEYVEDDEAYEEVKYAVHNLNYAEVEGNSDAKEIIVTTDYIDGVVMKTGYAAGYRNSI